MEVVEEAATLTTEVEQEWSAALNEPAFQRRRVELKENWAAVSHLLQEFVTRVHDDLVDDELNVLQQDFPLTIEDLAELQLQPSAKAAWNQIELALFYALNRLLESLETLDAESAHHMQFRGGTLTETHWWQAGAFTLILERAKALSLVLEYQMGVLENLREAGEYVGDAPVARQVQPPASFEAMRIASTAISKGMHEFALIAELRWVRSLYAELKGIPDDQVPAPVSPHLGDIAELSGMADATALLEDACSRLGRGLPLDVGAGIVLAEVFHTTLAELIIRPQMGNAPEE